MKYLIDRIPGNVFKPGRKFLIEELEEVQWLEALGTAYSSRIRTPALVKLLTERWQLPISTGKPILEVTPEDVVFIVLPLVKIKRGMPIEPTLFPLKFLKLQWVKSIVPRLSVK